MFSSSHRMKLMGKAPCLWWCQGSPGSHVGKPTHPSGFLPCMYYAHVSQELRTQFVMDLSFPDVLWCWHLKPATLHETEANSGRRKHLEHPLVFLPTSKVGQPAWNFNCNSEPWGSGQLVFQGRGGSLVKHFSHTPILWALCVKLCSSIQLGYSCCNIKGNFCKKACAHDFPLDTGSPAGILLPCKPVPKIPAGNFPTNSTWDPYNYVTCCQKPQQN